MAKRPPSRPPVTPPVRSPHMQEIAQGYSPNTTAKGAVAPGRSSLDSKPGTLSGMNAQAAGQAAQVLQESKNQMRDAKMSPAEISYALASQNVHTLAPATPKYEITGSPAFNAKLAQAQMPVPNVQNVAPGQNPNLPPLFNTAAPAALSSTNFMNSAAGQAQQPGMVQQALNSIAKAFGQGVYNEYGNPVKGLSAVDLMVLGGAAGSGVMGQGAVKVSGAKDVIKWLQPGVISKTGGISSGVKAWNTVKSLISKTFTEEKIIQSITANGQRYKLVGGVSKLTPWKIATAITAAGSVVMMMTWMAIKGKESQATGAWAAKEEMPGMLGMYARDMFRDGNYEAGSLFLDMAQEGANVSLSAMPGGKGTIQGTNAYLKAFNDAVPILKEHYANMAEMEAEGMTPQQTADFWLQYHERVEANKTAQAKASVDYYNAQRRITEQEILRAREQSNRESAAFWIDYQKQLAEMERKEREEQAAFWIEYKKLVMKMNEESRGSSLNFGLLR